MISPRKAMSRSPLKETDANMKQPLSINGNQDGSIINSKKRSLEKLEQQQQRKKLKVERTRSIEGAVLVSKPAVKTVNESKVTPKELIEWQNNWKKIMRRDSRIYFDSKNIDNLKLKKNMDKRKDLLKKGFLSLGAQITQFFDTSVTIVITTRPIDNIHLLNDTDILARAKKNFMKVWNYDKAVRFLTNLDVDFDALLRNKLPILTTPSLSNLLQNEKIYGPNDRDPRTKRDDIRYFKYPHVYLYDICQTWAPIITLEWRPQDLMDEDNLPYPTLKMGTFGRCPFIGDRNCDEISSRRILKRYQRDKLNKPYALKLRQLYQYHADTELNDNNYDNNPNELLFIPHTCSDSRERYEYCFKNDRKLFSGVESLNNRPNDISLTNESITTKERIIENDGNINNDNETNEHNNINRSENKKEQVITISDGDRNENSKPITVLCNTTVDINESNNIGNTNSTNFEQIPIIANKNGPIAWKEPPTPVLKHPSLVTLTRQETEELHDDLCALTKRPSKVPFEIRASGVHQSNDVATSFGNGLGPTKASVMSKNIKTLNKLVDRKLDTTALQRPLPNPFNDANSASLMKETNLKQPISKKCLSLNNIQGNIINRILTGKQQTEVVDAPKIIKKSVVKNSGYCENCRVKYDSLDEHVLSEKHSTFADNDTNFEAIDSLMNKLSFQF